VAVPFVAALRERRERLSVVALSAAAGAGAGLAVTGGTTRGLLQGTLSGVLISILMQARDLAVSRAGLGRWPFGVFVVVTVVTMVATIWAGLALAALPWLAREGAGSWRTYVLAFVVSVLVSVGFSTWFALDRLLGGDVLVGLLTGRYHRPRHEERVFLFADLDGSTALAERFGELRYHTFLNRALVDLADPVQRHGGAIYQYAGDEVVVTWPLERGVQKGACLRCAMAIADAFAASSAAYEREFGAAPRFRLALHCGPVVAGEIGDLRREIVYTGDTVNTAARIEAAAKAGDHTLVVSADVLARAPLPEGLSARSLGLQTFRGKDTALELFAVEPGSD
jgi:adenylate cyclase